MHDFLANATRGKESTGTLNQRDVRALTEYMSVLGRIGLAKDTGRLDIIVSQSGKERPDDCDCSEHFDSDDLGCWPCYRDGFETAHPNPIDE